MGTNMKYSIKKQFAGVICLLIAGTILLCWFINNTLLENYYLNNKQNVLMYAYHYINAATNEGKFNTEEFDIEFQKIIGKYNISFIVLDAETQTLKASANDYEILSKELLKNIFGSGSNPKARLLEKETVTKSALCSTTGRKQNLSKCGGYWITGTSFYSETR